VWLIIKRLSLGVLLIASASAVLLLSDLRSRKSARAAKSSGAQKIFKIALLQHSSQTILGEGIRGMLDALANKGFVDGQNIQLQRYNAEGDLPTSVTIARDITDGRFDLILTVSTPSLQSVANANKEGKTKHVFALVTDPYAAGVGINRTNHLDHPRQLAGFGTMQPIEAAFTLARQMRPELKSVGVAWNAAEANSEAQMKVARKICQGIGIELLEATVDNSSGVYEAANSLIARGVEALWVPGDNTVLMAIDSLVQAGRKGKIPVFTVIPPFAEKGALFDVGANYYEVGRLAGDLAAEILNGRDPATIAIDNVVPQVLDINKTALHDLKDKWQVPEELALRADVLIDETGTHRKAQVVSASATPPQRAPLSRKWRIAQVAFSENPSVEEAAKGVEEGLKEAGLVEGRDFEMKHRNAQGDIATLNTVVDASLAEGADLFLVSTTPALQVALKRVQSIPLVFTLVANPVLAGAGKSAQDHLASVTGSYVVSPFDEMMEPVKQCVPGIKRIGTLFVPSEINSVFYKDKLVAAAGKAGMEVEAVGVSSSGEVADATLALCSRQIQAICQISDNLTGTAFASIAQAARRGKMPLFGFSSLQAGQGAILCVARDYFDNGREAGLMAARIMRGEDPAKIPFAETRTARLLINLQSAEACGVNVPESLVKRADRVIGKDGKIIQAPPPSAPAKPLAKKWNVHLIEYNQVLDVEDAEKGVLVGLQKTGLMRGRDYETRISNAQGDMITVSGLVDAATTDGADLIITVSTPTLQAAIRRARSVPVVFTYCANALVAGAGKSLTDHLPNVTGVQTAGAYHELLMMIRECLPNARTLGTLYVPSEVNSVFHRDQIIKVAGAMGIQIETMAAETSGDVPDAALALCNRKIDAICQVPGNLTASAFPAIARAAQKGGLPLFAGLSSQARAGAAAVASRDYFDAGVDAGLMAARIMRGENPADIPIESFSKTKIILNLPAAKACGLTLPQGLIARADEVIGGDPARSH